MKRFAILLAVVGVLSCVTDTVEAQRRSPGFVSRPALSPWILARGNGGGGGAVGTYFGFVRPMTEMRNFATQTDRMFNYQQQQMAYEQQELGQMLTSENHNMLQLRPSSQTPGGSRAASFLNYSRFYPQSNAAPIQR